jgi:peptide-methionine (S)-S-oxide reductase
MEKATFGAGCFWGVETTFRQVDGVVDAAVGYEAGHTDNPTYKDVCMGTTGHAEVLEVVFDPETVSYDRLLEVFWRCHDPTQLNRQGPDVGTQYRSIILTHSAEQDAQAQASKAKMDASGVFSSPIATEIRGEAPFWRAEEYHQRYHEKHPGTGCGVGWKL